MLLNDDYWNKRIYNEDGRLDGIEEGKKIGKIENSIEIVKTMLKDNVR